MEDMGGNESSESTGFTWLDVITVVASNSGSRDDHSLLNNCR